MKRSSSTAPITGQRAGVHHPVVRNTDRGTTHRHEYVDVHDFLAGRELHLPQIQARATHHRRHTSAADIGTDLAGSWRCP